MASIWRRKDRDDFSQESEQKDKEPEKRSVFASPVQGGPSGSPFKVDAPSAPPPAGDARSRPVPTAPLAPSANPAAASATFDPPPPLRDVGTTVLGKDISFKGELRGNGSVKIDGYFEGSIVLDREVTILRNGRVHAIIEADMIHVEGEIQGNVSARTKIIISSSGRMFGDIKAKSVVVAEGATFKGRIEMDIPDKKPASSPPPPPPPSVSAPIPAAPSAPAPAPERLAAPSPGQPSRPVMRPRPIVSPGEDLSQYPTMSEPASRPVPPPAPRPAPGRSPFSGDDTADGPFATT